MNDSPDGRIKLSVLGGFLGSGKTTWLRHNLHHGLMHEALVIVNEAAATPVDDALLLRSVRLKVLAGGCACCDARRDLVALLRQICDGRVSATTASGRVDRIVLETSGLADPGRILAAITTDPVLQHHIVVSEIVVAVDALHGLQQIREEPLGRRQIETAHKLVITKVDQADAQDLKRLIATLSVLNPGAAISGAVMGSSAVLPDPEVAMADTLPDLSDGTVSPILAITLELDETIDWPAFSVWLSALIHARGDDIMRVKGMVRTPRGRLLLQSVRKVVQSPEILSDATSGPASPGDSAIVLIGRNIESAALFRSLRHFAGASQAPQSTASRSTSL